MTDRELLELAAKAARMELDYTIRPDKKAFYHSERNALALVDGGWFAPLTDDGDALRLAVKLGLAVSIDSVEQETWAHHEQAFKGSSEKWKCCPTSNNGDEDGYAATRRAIVRAAAEIGRQMP